MRIILDSIRFRIKVRANTLRLVQEPWLLNTKYCASVATSWVAATALAGCGGSGSDTSSTPAASLAAVAGKALFFDTSLSASGQQACGTCHVPTRAFTGDPTADHGLPVPLGEQAQQPLTDGYDPKDPAAYNLPAQCAPTAATSAASK
jgi:cytochrome c peroxidase